MIILLVAVAALVPALVALVIALWLGTGRGGEHGRWLAPRVLIGLAAGAVGGTAVGAILILSVVALRRAVGH